MKPESWISFRPYRNVSTYRAAKWFITYQAQVLEDLEDAKVI
jgi:hypothetical protein